MYLFFFSNFIDSSAMPGPHMRASFVSAKNLEIQDVDDLNPRQGVYNEPRRLLQPVQPGAGSDSSLKSPDASPPPDASYTCFSAAKCSRALAAPYTSQPMPQFPLEPRRFTMKDFARILREDSPRASASASASSEPIHSEPIRNDTVAPEEMPVPDSADLSGIFRSPPESGRGESEIPFRRPPSAFVPMRFHFEGLRIPGRFRRPTGPYSEGRP